MRTYLLEKENYSEIIAPSVVDINDPVLAALLSELMNLYKEKCALQYATKTQIPAIDQTEYKIAETRKSLLENLSNLIKATEISMADADRQLNEIQKEISKLPATEKAFINIQRKYKLNDQIYTYLLTKRS